MRVLSLALWGIALALAGCGDGDSDLGLGAAGGGGGTGGGAGEKLTVVVLVVDSLMPREIGAPLTPTPALAAFRANATAYAESRSVFSAETIPNHVAMMTGTYPARNGIPTNNYWNRQGNPADRDLSLPTEVQVDNLFTTIKRQCPALKTAAVLSKDYLYEVFSACGYSGQDCGRNTAPDFHFDPTSSPLFVPSPAGLTPDAVTMQTALDAMQDADFIFINLGEVDRIGHADATGAAGIPLLRTAVLITTDTLINLFIESLRQAGRWERTVMFVVSDHGMDWSLLPNFIDLDAALAATGGLFVAYNGGTASIYLADQAERGTAAGFARLQAAREAVAALPGVEHVWYTSANPQDPGHQLPASLASGHENFGDLVATAAAGYRMSPAASENNLIAGNHGHLPTFHNTFMVGGGAAFVKHQLIAPPTVLAPLDRHPGQSENIDVAPTVAWLLGLPTAGYDGRVLREAFDLAASPSHCGILD